MVCAMHLVLNTGGGVAENALVKNGQHAAASTLADGGASCAEVVGAGDNGSGVSAVQVGDSKDIGGTALSGAIEAGAGNIWRLALSHLGRKSYSEAGAEGGDGCDGELHCGG